MNQGIRIFSSVALLLSISYCAESQGSFVNLDFEQANVPVVPSGQFGTAVLSTDGLPGWTAYMNNNPVTTILHNNEALSAAFIAIFGPNWNSTQILQSSFSAGIASSSAGPPVTAAIAEVGQIPQTAASLRFLVGPGDFLQATFAGHAISLAVIGTGSNYKILGGDISAFAGQTGELRFTAPLGGAGLLDDIQFSTQAIPEPSAFGLVALGVTGFGLGRKRRRKVW